MSEEKQSGKLKEMVMNMEKNYNDFIVPIKAMEPFIELTKLQQRQGLNMTRAWIDHFWKMGEANRSGDVKKVWETYMESNKDLLTTCQESLKEQATARYELWKAFIPAIGKPMTIST